MQIRRTLRATVFVTLNVSALFGAWLALAVALHASAATTAALQQVQLASKASPARHLPAPLATPSSPKHRPAKKAGKAASVALPLPVAPPPEVGEAAASPTTTATPTMTTTLTASTPTTEPATSAASTQAAPTTTDAQFAKQTSAGSEPTTQAAVAQDSSAAQTRPSQESVEMQRQIMNAVLSKASSMLSDAQREAPSEAKPTSRFGDSLTQASSLSPMANARRLHANADQQQQSEPANLAPLSEQESADLLRQIFSSLQQSADVQLGQHSTSGFGEDRGANADSAAIVQMLDQMEPQAQRQTSAESPADGQFPVSEAPSFFAPEKIDKSKAHSAVQTFAPTLSASTASWRNKSVAGGKQINKGWRGQRVSQQKESWRSGEQLALDKPTTLAATASSTLRPPQTTLADVEATSEPSKQTTPAAAAPAKKTQRAKAVKKSLAKSARIAADGASNSTNPQQQTPATSKTTSTTVAPSAVAKSTLAIVWTGPSNAQNSTAKPKQQLIKTRGQKSPQASKSALNSTTTSNPSATRSDRKQQRERDAHVNDGTDWLELGHEALHAGSVEALRDSLPGEPGIDYPTLASLPRTSFACSKQSCSGGYYADTESRCQAFHVCQSDGRMDSFLCANGTVFSQQSLVCVWWWQADCKDAPNYYKNNDAIYCANAASSDAAGSSSASSSQLPSLDKSSAVQQPKPHRDTNSGVDQRSDS